MGVADVAGRGHSGLDLAGLRQGRGDISQRRGSVAATLDGTGSPEGSIEHRSCRVGLPGSRLDCCDLCQRSRAREGRADLAGRGYGGFDVAGLGLIQGDLFEHPRAAVLIPQGASSCERCVKAGSRQVGFAGLGLRQSNRT